jgi:hypothetical protein
MTMAQAWLFIASGLAGPARGIHRVRKGALPKGALMKGAVGVCVAASAIALAPCANADDDSFLANLSQHGIFTFKNPQGLVAAGHTICTDLANGVSKQDEVNRFQLNHLQANDEPPPF